MWRVETGQELTGLHAVVEDQRPVGLGQTDEMLEPAVGEGHRFGQSYLVFNGGVGASSRVGLNPRRKMAP